MHSAMLVLAQIYLLEPTAFILSPRPRGEYKNVSTRQSRSHSRAANVTKFRADTSVRIFAGGYARCPPPPYLLELFCFASQVATANVRLRKWSEREWCNLPNSCCAFLIVYSVHLTELLRGTAPAHSHVQLGNSHHRRTAGYVR